MHSNGFARSSEGLTVANILGLVAITLVLLLGLIFLTDLGVSSFSCMNSQGDNLTCALGVVAGHLPFYVAAVGVVALVTYVLRRWTR